MVLFTSTTLISKTFLNHPEVKHLFEVHQEVFGLGPCPTACPFFCSSCSCSLCSCTCSSRQEARGCTAGLSRGCSGTPGKFMVLHFKKWPPLCRRRRGLAGRSPRPRRRGPPGTIRGTSCPGGHRHFYLAVLASLSVPPPPPPPTWTARGPPESPWQASILSLPAQIMVSASGEGLKSPTYHTLTYAAS